MLWDSSDPVTARLQSSLGRDPAAVGSLEQSLLTGRTGHYFFLSTPRGEAQQHQGPERGPEAEWARWVGGWMISILEPCHPPLESLRGYPSPDGPPQEADQDMSLTTGSSAMAFRQCAATWEQLGAQGLLLSRSRQSHVSRVGVAACSSTEIRTRGSEWFLSGLGWPGVDPLILF